MNKFKNNFVHLHLHTDYSLLDGACRMDRLFERAEKLGMSAVAITDHGNVFGFPNFVYQAKKHNIKPILGCEMYSLSRESIDIKEKRPLYHTILLAKDIKGYYNLCKLVSIAHTKGFYYKPRTNFDLLRQYSKGLVCLTGCIQGYIPQMLLDEKFADAQSGLEELIDIFGKQNLFIEVQNHGIDLQEKVLPLLYKLADDNGVGVVATNDCHYVLQGDWAAHDAMLCVQTGSKITDENRMRMQWHQFYVKSREEMELIFKDRPDAIDNTLKIAEMCNVELPYGENHYPVFTMSDDQKLKFPTNLSFLKHLCYAGLSRRYGVKYKKFIEQDGKLNDEQKHQKMLCDRIDYEFSIIENAGFVDYFLIVSDFVNWAKDNDIVVGPGRGSGAGCILAYLLKITDIDPIAFNLIFERFLNPERISPPDFDIDFCMRRRGEVIDYVRKKYGNENVANIITYGTFGAKMVLRDLFRVHDLPYQEADLIAKMVPEGINVTLKSAIEQSSELRSEIERSQLVANVVKEGEILEGMVRNTGTHACGVVISDRPMSNLIPVTLQEGVLTTQYAKEAVEDLGLLKMDFLGLKTLTVISDTEKNIRLRKNFEKFDVGLVPLNDNASFALMNSGNTIGVFQFESSGIQKWCMQFGFSSVEEISALSALYRPGPMDWLPDYIAGKKDPSKIEYAHPLLKDVCRSTYGILVFQEQVMQAAQIIAGYSMGGADILRRAMGKKKPEVMAQQRAVFVEGAKKTNNIPKGKAEEIFSILEKFAGYGFNKSHSDSYGVIGYRTAYLKAHFPVEFMAALMSCDLGNPEKIEIFIAEASRMKIPVLGPDINISREVFTPYVSDNDQNIRFGLSAIKGVGEIASNNIIIERDSNGKFESLGDFVQRVDTRVVNKRVLESLILSGAFDTFEYDRKHLLNSLPNIVQEVASLEKDKQAGQSQLFNMFDDSCLNNCNMHVDERGEKMSNKEKLNNEKALLGFYISGHPLNNIKKIIEIVDSPRDKKISELEKNTAVVKCGVIGNVTKKISKKTNRMWAYFDFEMINDRQEINCFPDCFERLGNKLNTGALVVIAGIVRMRDGMNSFNIESIDPIDVSVPKYIKSVKWTIDIKSSRIDEFLTELRQYVSENEGSISHVVEFDSKDCNGCAFKIADSLRSLFDYDKFDELTKNDAVKNLTLIAK